MPIAVNWQNSPLHLIDDIFEREQGGSRGHALGHGDIPARDQLRLSFEKINGFFEEKVTHEQWHKIPSLNQVDGDELSHGQLVRFRGMVQDVNEVEMYLARCKVRDLKSGNTRIETGRYRECIEIGSRDELVMDTSEIVELERRPVILISVPGETDWVTREYLQQNTRKKSVIDAKSASQGASADISMNNIPIAIKRSFSSASSVTTSDEDSNMSVDSKRFKPEEAEEAETEMDVPDNTSGDDSDSQDGDSMVDVVTLYEVRQIIIAKIYQSLDDINLNDVVEAIGVLAPPGNYSRNGKSTIAFDTKWSQDDTRRDALLRETIPHSFIPVIHVIRLVPLTHSNPLLPIEIDLMTKNSIAKDAYFLRIALHDFLVRALLGDALAARYLLYNLVSKIYLRKDRLCLGKLALNLFNLPQGCRYGERLTAFLQLLLSKCVYFPVNPTTLNATDLLPRTDHCSLKLFGGPFQLSPNTHLVFDEVEMTAAHRPNTPQSQQNITFLRKLIESQKVSFSHGTEFLDSPIDVPCLILSHNTSILSSDLTVHLDPEPTPNSGPHTEESIATLFSGLEAELDRSGIVARLRQYMTVIQQSRYEVPSDMQKFIQGEITRSRRQRAENASLPDDLHTLLVLSRFIILTRGQSNLSREAWEEAKSLEGRRKQRLERPGRLL